jgi:hypothetical protein
MAVANDMSLWGGGLQSQRLHGCANLLAEAHVCARARGDQACLPARTLGLLQHTFDRADVA